ESKLRQRAVDCGSYWQDGCGHSCGPWTPSAGGVGEYTVPGTCITLLASLNEGEVSWTPRRQSLEIPARQNYPSSVLHSDGLRTLPHQTIPRSLRLSPNGGSCLSVYLGSYGANKLLPGMFQTLLEPDENAALFRMTFGHNGGHPPRTREPDHDVVRL